MKALVMLLAPLRRDWYAMNSGFSRADTDKSLCFSRKKLDTIALFNKFIAGFVIQ
jgi:hypothetical protein